MNLLPRVDALERKMLWLEDVERRFHQDLARIRMFPEGSPTLYGSTTGIVTISLTVLGVNSLAIANCTVESPSGMVVGTTDASGHISFSTTWNGVGGAYDIFTTKSPRFPRNLAASLGPYTSGSTNSATVTAPYDSGNYRPIPGYANPIKLTQSINDSFFGTDTPLAHIGGGSGSEWDSGANSVANVACGLFSCLALVGNIDVLYFVDYAGAFNPISNYPVNTGVSVQCPSLTPNNTHNVVFGTWVVTWSEILGFRGVATGNPNSGLYCNTATTLTVTEI